VAVEIQGDWARAKYNLALCRLQLEGANAALESLKEIKATDRDASYIGQLGLKDADLRPLLEDPAHSEAARSFLESLSRETS